MNYVHIFFVLIAAHHQRGYPQDKDSLWYDRLAKVDVRTGVLVVWQEPDCYPGEALFVGTPGGKAEDDGVILSVVLDGACGGNSKRMPHMYHHASHCITSVAKQENPSRPFSWCWTRAP